MAADEGPFMSGSIMGNEFCRLCNKGVGVLAEPARGEILLWCEVGGLAGEGADAASGVLVTEDVLLAAGEADEEDSELLLLPILLLAPEWSIELLRILSEK